MTATQRKAKTETAENNAHASNVVALNGVEDRGTVEIAIGALVDDPKNVRHVEPSAEGIAALAANIKARGLIQNLVVRPLDDGSFAVVAGSRRRRALLKLVEDGDRSEADTVTCRQVTEEEAVEISLSENIHREQMHPADQMIAWGQLAASGMTPEDIATRHGCGTDLVKRRLALAALSPAVMEAFQSDEFGIDCAMAFTLTVDHATQDSVLETIRASGNVFPNTIRRMIVKEEVAGNHMNAKLVGREAYEAAGGEIREDLFGDTVYFKDGDLLAQLAEAKIEAEKQRLLDAGWLWVEVKIPFYHWDHGQNMRRVYPTTTELDEATMAKVDELEQALSLLEDEGEEDGPEGVALQEQIAELQGPETYEEAEMETAGGWLTVEQSGEMVAHMGFVRPADDPKRKATKAEDKPAKSPYSNALTDDMAFARRTYLRAEMIKNPEVAADLFMFETVRAYGARWQSSDVFDLSVNRPEGRRVQGESGFMGEFNGLDAMESAIADIPLSWVEMADTGKAFKAFRKLTAEDKTRVLAFVASNSLMPTLPHEDDAALVQAEKDMGGKMRDYWTPNAELFDRLPKRELLAIGKDTLGTSWADNHTKVKKGDIAEKLGAAFDGSETLKRAKTVTAKLAKWIPTPFKPVVGAKGKGGSSSPSTN